LFAIDDFASLMQTPQMQTSQTLSADEYWMKYALGAAEKAGAQGEVPVGAVIVRPTAEKFETWEIVGESGNLKEAETNPLGHAELLVISRASLNLKKWRLSDCALYVTLEPCVMCAGAIVHARLKEVIFGALDPKAGAVSSLYQILSDARLNHQPQVRSGIYAEESSILLKDFFKSRRS
jgi:tRNA(adenine34) deaminase